MMLTGVTGLGVGAVGLGVVGLGAGVGAVGLGAGVGTAGAVAIAGCALRTSIINWLWNQVPAAGATAIASFDGSPGSHDGSKRLPSASGTLPGVVAWAEPSDSPGGLTHTYACGRTGIVLKV